MKVVSKALFTDGFLNLCSIRVLTARKGEFPVLQEQPGRVRPQPSSVSQIPALSTSFIFICVFKVGGEGGFFMLYQRLKGWVCIFFFLSCLLFIS